MARFGHASPDRTGAYRIASARADSRVSYADFAIALVDHAELPQRGRVRLVGEAG